MAIDHPPHVPAERVVDFDIYAPPGGRSDLFAGWRTLQRRDSPAIVWTPRNEGHWIAARAEIIQEVLADYERFSSRTIIIPKSHGADHNLIPTTIDPPQHRPYRQSLNESLATARVRAMEDGIREISSGLIDGFRDRGACNFTTDYAEILPIKIFLSLMDLPMEDTVQTKYWSDQLIRPDGSMTFAEALGLLTDYIAPFVDQRKGKRGDDMLSSLVNTPVDGRCLTQEECLKLAVQVLIAGIDTVVNFLGFVFHHLATHQVHRRQLAAEPQLIPEAVEEYFRRFGIVTIAREVRRDTEFHGVAMKAGEMIATPTPLAAIDDTYNSDANAVDFHRATRHSLTFGSGHHTCPGRNLARAEVRITLEEWLRRIPEFRLAEGAGITFTSGIVGVVDSLPLAWR